ncbi:hypothetical protein [Bacteroides sp. 224]|nr:hypothetical protein [Bacteroides sp. 224]
MGKNNKKKKGSKKNEEAQGQKVIKILFVSLIILGLLMMIGFSLLNK